ncbi:MAG: PPC domain-containing protein [Sandaracinaceae bacterium]|nr:PPC domain-containing protein [Sandaracinaceae bacterium]
MRARHLAFALLLTACAPSALDEAIAETGVYGPFEEVPEDQKFDGSVARGPRDVAGADTEVWAVRNQWGDTTTAAAREAGVAWGEGSGLDWEQKFHRWIESFELEARAGGSGQTFVIPTPYGMRRFHAPTLECAEVALLLRATFASWYHLPFYIQGWDSETRQAMFAGHFGFVNREGVRIGRFPRFRTSYADHEGRWQAGQPWPTDATLRARRLGNDDKIAFLSTAAQELGAGAYFDEMFLNKRVGYFARLLLLYFGSVNLADGANAYHVRPEAIEAGDFLLERWQRRGIGHVMPVMRVVRHAEDALEVSIASGSMPRREPVWEDPASSRTKFLMQECGGPGQSYSGEVYAQLGGGLRRWRTAVLRSGRWVNDVLERDRPSFINDMDYEAIAARPARFGEILRTPSPEERRAAAVTAIEGAREHLRMYPASCSARTRREEGFAALYAVLGEQGTSRETVDAQYRLLEDYVFAELTYEQARTCCWNSTTAQMAEIVLDYAAQEQMQAGATGMCAAPSVFRSEAGTGYGRWSQHAASLGRSADWRPWTEDEVCAPRAVAEDALGAREVTAFCELGEAPPPPPPPPACDPAAADDAQATAGVLAIGETRPAQVCAMDEDWYRIDGAATVTIHFTNASGDLDLEAYDAAGTRTGSSAGTSDSETVTGTGTFYVRVFGYSGAANTYTIEAR